MGWAAGYDAAVAGTGDIAAALGAWPWQVESLTPLAGGWNSSTWLVTTSGGRYIAKLADLADADGLVSSLRVAEFAAARGLSCGAPVRTSGSALVPLPAGVLALLRYEPGTPPDLAVPGQVRRAGRLLARAHKILADCRVGDQARYQWPWEWVTRCQDTIAIPAEVLAAARGGWHEAVAPCEGRFCTTWPASQSPAGPPTPKRRGGSPTATPTRIERGIARGSGSPHANHDGLADAYHGLTH